MSLTTREAKAVCKLIDWARGRRVTDNGTVVTDEDATGAARLLAGSVNRSLQAGPRPEHLTLRWTRPVRERLLALTVDAYSDAEAIRTVLGLLDRIDRQDAATAAGQENEQ